MAAADDPPDPTAPTGALSDPPSGLAHTVDSAPATAETVAAETAAGDTAPSDPRGDHRVPTDALFEWGHLYALEQLGAGGFGQVYRAYDPVLDRDVALKLHRADDRSAAYLAEARSLARLKHPNVLAVYGADVHDGRAGIWTDLIDGHDFETIVRRDGPLSAAETARVGVELCRALAAVHGAGMVHGDIKTHNVMRARGGHIVLMDFGAVSPLGGDSGANAGTLVAMAPELLRGEAPTVRADIYALGVLLYRLACAKWPYDDLSVAAVSRGDQPKVPLRDRRADLPSAFVEVVETAMAAEAADRPASVGVMERSLMALQAGSGPRRPPPPEPPPEPPRRAPEPPPEPPAARLTPGHIAAAVVILGLAIAWAVWPSATPERPTAAPPDAAPPPDAALPDAAPPPTPASALAQVPETEPVDRGRLELWRTAAGTHLLVPPHIGGKRAASYVGDGETFYRQPSTGASRSAPERWSYTFWDPRVPQGRHALFLYRDGAARIECGDDATLPLTRLEGEAARALVDQAALFGPRWTRRSHLLARGPDGVFYFVDHAAGIERADLRLFRGPRGALRQRPLDIATIGEAGSVFATADGELRQGPLPSFMGSEYRPGAPNDVHWIARDGDRQALTRLTGEAAIELIYGALQIYESDRIGSPCDEIFAAP